MLKNKIVVLNDKKEYYVLDELDHHGKKYLFLSLYHANDESIDENQFFVVELKLENANLTFHDIEDQNEAERISAIFLEKMKNGTQHELNPKSWTVINSF